MSTERLIERMLRQPPGASNAAPAAGPCVDGEMLAAWSSGSLRSAAAAAVEEHLSNCLRCQSMMAAFARTEPLAPTPSAWWQRWQVRWLVPLATAATVAALYVAIPDREMAVREPVADRGQMVPPRSSTGPVPDSAAAASAQRPAMTSDTQASRERQTKAPPASAEVPKSGQFAVGVNRGTATASETSAKAAPPAALASPPAAEAAAPSAAPSAPPVSPSVLPAPAPSPPAALREEAAGRVADSVQTLQARNANLEIVSPDKSVRWRIVGGRLERAAGSGPQWQSVALPDGVNLTAGHAPAASMVWLVGRAGAVYLLVDGAGVERIPFPETTDLSSVLGVDERQATITTADGRRFATANRGVTWTAR